MSAARPTRSGVEGRLLNAPGNFVFAAWDFGSQVDKALHAVELHPVQGQGADRFRAGKVPTTRTSVFAKLIPSLASRAAADTEVSMESACSKLVEKRAMSST